MLSSIGAVLGAFLLVYWKGRAEGKDKLRWEQEDERRRRIRNALDADDLVRRDIATGRLLDDDGHRRN
jgi:hypothetical protein